MNFEITDLSGAYLEPATHLWEAGWHDAHDGITPPGLVALRTTENFRDRLRKHMPNTRIAVEGTTLLGFCILKSNELDQMYVGPAARSRGVAQALMSDAEERLTQAGHTTAWLACAVGNNRAARFYEKCGWVNTGVSTEYMDTAEGPYALDVWRFEKDLTGT